MTLDPTIRAAVIGCGDMARASLRGILANFPNTQIAVVCEPSADSYGQTVGIFEDAGHRAPVNIPDLNRLLEEYSGSLDAAYVATPPVLHCTQATACMAAGLDVLVEKPMVMNADEAREMIDVRDRTGQLLVVGFQGSLSPQVRRAVEMLRVQELGPIQGIFGAVWQNWQDMFADAWRSDLEVSGGGFLFDTGAHMLNTVADLVGEDFSTVSALLNNNGGPVEVNAAIMGRLRSGALVTIHACGTTAPSCASDIRVFCSEGALRTGAWGRSLDIMRCQPDLNRDKGWEPVDIHSSLGVWEEFLSIREGLMDNPAPAELGLRLALLWNAIVQSAKQGGSPVRM